jgi:hypothetical protein
LVTIITLVPLITKVPVAAFVTMRTIRTVVAFVTNAYMARTVIMKTMRTVAALVIKIPTVTIVGNAVIN